MFLEVLRRRNPEFLRAAASLHAQGELPANSYALDLDAITANARALSQEAARHSLTVFAMTKQVGRNPGFCAAVQAGGIDAAVAVDMADARAVRAAGLRLGHLGHLVQVPTHEAAEAASYQPDYWTVFSRAKAGEAAAASSSRGAVQDVLLRIHADGDTFYQGHEGGFPADQVTEAADYVDKLAGARFAGITTFPALLFSEPDGTVTPTHNLVTLQRAAARLRESGRTPQINAPGTNSSVMLATLAEAGATQVEPGHALTGTTPLHAVRDDLPEAPAAAYVTEVSHLHGGRAYCFGGGLYIDPVFTGYQVRALVAPGGDFDSAFLADAEIPPPSAIDYYAMLTPADGNGAAIRPGDTVLFGFRIQAFFTRAHVVPISGIRDSAPAARGVWATDGTPALWPGSPVPASQPAGHAPGYRATAVRRPA
jgi:predicted amino acid racemase